MLVVVVVVVVVAYTPLGNIHISGDAPPREGGSDQKCHHFVIRGREGSDQSVT